MAKKDITLYGKILLIKTFGMSKIMYNLNMQTFTDQQLETFNKTMYDFLWNGKQRFMARDICEQKQSEGGLFMPNIYDVKKCMRIRWVIRTLINHQLNNDRTSTIIPMKYFTCLDKQYGTYLYALRVDDCKDKIMKTNIPIFYKECIVSFQELLRKTKSIRDRTDDIIWDNSELQHNNKPLRIMKWARKGFLNRQDISTNGIIDYQMIKERVGEYPNWIFDLQTMKKVATKQWLMKVKNENTSRTATINQIIETILSQKIHFSKDKHRMISKLESRDIKEILSAKNTDMLHKKKMYWEDKLDIKQNLWRDYIQSVCTNKLLPQKVREFNLRITHGGLNTETKLQKHGIKS